MKSYMFLTIAILAVAAFCSPVYAQTGVAQFSGFWTFDRAKTNMPRDFPEKLKDYKMLIASDQDRLIVKAQVVGGVEIRAGGGQSMVSGITSGSRGTGATSTGVSATGDSGSVETAPVNYNGTMALYFTAPETTYDLTGKEIKIEPPPGDRINGQLRLKAKVGKDGKSVELIAIRKMKGQQGETEITIRETWKLGDDGKSMKFQRNVTTPSARDEINLVLVKAAQ